MTRIAGADNSHNAFALDYLTGFTPAFDGRSDFHNRYNLQKKVRWIVSASSVAGSGPRFLRVLFWNAALRRDAHAGITHEFYNIIRTPVFASPVMKK